jgi:hypothetical protein
MNPLLYQLNSSHIQSILDFHNEKRNLIAIGGLGQFPQAIRMAKMIWNDELALLAGLNTKQCVMKHDACRNTSEKIQI